MPDPPPPQDVPSSAARPWEQAWQEALYGTDGFYRRFAPAEHFATSAQGVTGAGALLAEAALALARRHGCSRVVDLGCGRGELLAELRALDPDLRLTGVDVVERPADVAVDDWLVSPGGSALPPGLCDLQDTLVLAHEWLDVVPCPVVERDADGVWRTVEVQVEVEGEVSAGPHTATERLGPPAMGADLAWADRWLGPEVHRAESGLPRDLAFADLVGRVRSGVVVAVDYGHVARDRPAHGTLTGFRGGRQVPPVPDGSCDLTAHVAIDSLVAMQPPAAPAADVTLSHPLEQCHVSRQRDILPTLLAAAPPGGAPLSPVGAGPATPVPHDLAGRDPTAYLGAVARRSALTTLTARGGLGDFWWVVAPVVASARPGA